MKWSEQHHLLSHREDRFRPPCFTDRRTCGHLGESKFEVRFVPRSASHESLLPLCYHMEYLFSCAHYMFLYLAGKASTAVGATVMQALSILNAIYSPVHDRHVSTLSTKPSVGIQRCLLTMTRTSIWVQRVLQMTREGVFQLLGLVTFASEKKHRAAFAVWATASERGAEQEDGRGAAPGERKERKGAAILHRLERYGTDR